MHKKNIKISIILMIIKITFILLTLSTSITIMNDSSNNIMDSIIYY